MSKPCRVLLTGAGSGVGQSIFKALRLSNLPVTIIAADISPMNAALYVADESVIIPRVEEPKALETIIDLLLKYRIDVVMIGSEFELEFFSINKEKIESCSKAIIIVAPPATVAISNDKWLTTEFLRANKLPYAEAYLPKNQFDAKHVAESWGYPVILKTRCGTSSRHVHVIENSNHLNNVLDNIPMAMLQRVIDIPTSELGSEYTCSVFKTKNGLSIFKFSIVFA